MKKSLLFLMCSLGFIAFQLQAGIERISVDFKDACLSPKWCQDACEKRIGKKNLIDASCNESGRACYCIYK